MFRCQALVRLLHGFKVEKPNMEVLSWCLDIDEDELRRFLVEKALIKDLDSIEKAPDLAQKVRDSVAMNIKHAMKA